MPETHYRFADDIFMKRLKVESILNLVDIENRNGVQFFSDKYVVVFFINTCLIAKLKVQPFNKLFIKMSKY